MRVPTILMLALAAQPMALHAHVTLPPGGAAAGSEYAASFRVGHACKDASATTAIRVQLPPGFVPIEVLPRPGWKATLSAGTVEWVADSPEVWLPAKERASFTVRGRLADTPGTLWFKVLQVCDRGSADWSEVPAHEAHKPPFPAARLDVLAPGGAPARAASAATSHRHAP